MYAIVRRAWLWLIVPLSVLVVLALAATAVVLPPRLVEGGLNSADRAKEIGDLRTALIAILAGVTVGAGTVVAALNLAETRRQNRNSLALQQRAQVTDRFTRAIEQLGSDKVDVRIGAIYALEQIAQDSPELHRPIMEVFVAFLREHSTKTLGLSFAARQAGGEGEDSDARLGRADLQAIGTVIGRRNLKYDATHFRVQLPNVDLRSTDLTDAHLEGAFLAQAHLEGSNLLRAHLEEARLPGTHLDHCWLVAAHMERAVLVDVDLEGSTLTDAHLEGTTFVGGRFPQASLAGAHLEGAFFMRESDLSQARGLTQEQLDSAILDETIQPPPGLTVRATLPAAVAKSAFAKSQAMLAQAKAMPQARAAGGHPKGTGQPGESLTSDDEPVS